MPNNRQYDVFVSYSHKDRDLVSPLVQLLTVNACRVFWDVNSLEPGDVWPKEIESAIVGCKRFVLLWCCDTIDSEYVAKELALAVEHGKVIIPVLLCQLPAPIAIADRQWIDLRGKVNHVCPSEGELAARHRMPDPIPPVGAHSSGKSSLINAVLGGAAVGAVLPAVVGFLTGSLACTLGTKNSEKRSDDLQVEIIIRNYFESLASR